MTKASDAPGQLVEVAVGLPVSGTFHYLVPARLAARAKIGARVQAPFGKRKVVSGFIVGFPQHPSRPELREVEDIPDPEPIFGAAQLPFYRFIADYYFAPLGEVLRTALPAGLFNATRPVLAITGEGRLSLKNPLLEPAHRQILEALAGGEELTLKALAGRTGLDANKEAQRLVRWGWLAQRYRLSAPTAKRKSVPVWRLREGLSPEEAIAMLPRRAPKREQVLDILAAGRDWLTLAQMQSRGAANPRPTLNALEAAGLVESGDREVYREADHSLAELALGEVTPTAEQEAAVAAVASTMDREAYQAFCLHGVTGSGKTEVYLRLVRRCLDAGRAAIVLVPEISLTPQFLGRFIARLGPVVAPYHSSLSDGERYDQWRRMQRGEARVVVGARSGLFAPFSRIGIIVVDEEHETSFKQEDGVPYQARDLALKLGTMHRCPVVLGSATPSLESYAAARAGRYRLLELTRRPAEIQMPKVEVVDMRLEMERRRHEKRRRGKRAEEEAAAEAKEIKSLSERRVLSKPLAEALRETLAAGEQAILFLNRRGYATYAFCLECGKPLVCPLCDIALTYYERSGRLHCHYCDFTTDPPQVCPHCGSIHLFYGGMGTERLEEEVAGLLPDARVARLDRDAVRTRQDLLRVLQTFARHEADVLVGTQMVAKGHDFPKVTLVGVVDADAALKFPDFRAAERAFSLVSQVAGRAGRAARPGRVMLQSFDPEHYAIRAASRHDYTGFFEAEQPRREKLGYPPAGRLAVLKIVTPNARLGLQLCRTAAQVAQAVIRESGVSGAQALGPSASLLHRVRGKHRWNLLLKASSAGGLHRLCGGILARLEKEKPPSGTIRLDVDPVSVI